MSKTVKVAIAGLGNCASALIQGVDYYRNASSDETIPGLMHVKFGDYHVGDIEFVGAFEINEKKIGKKISEAIWVAPNSTPKMCEVPEIDALVYAAPIFDGVGPHTKDIFHCYNEEKVKSVDIADTLREINADILVNFLPVGSEDGSRAYAQACLDAGVAFANGIPTFICSDLEWARKFEEKSLPIAGDDIKSQLGATILHRVITQLALDRGIRLENTYQLNIGGNTDFRNMTAEYRLETKRTSKTKAVKSVLPYDVLMRIGSSDFVPFLKDEKICYIQIKGSGFGNQPMSIDLKLSVIDSPNSAGVMIDVIRSLKIALDRKIGGPLISASSYFFKHPPEQFPDNICHKMVEEFIQDKRKR